jgi:MFS family permease
VNASALGTRGAFASLRQHRNYRLYFFGQVVSLSGTWIQNIAQAWLVLTLTHSATALGVLSACQFAPFAVGGLYGGVIADRLDVRKVLLFTQTTAMVSAGALTALTLSNLVAVWEVFLFAAVSGTANVFDIPARQTFVIEMVGREDLPNAVALNSAITSASRVVGPAIGGVLIAGAGVGMCFAVNTVSFAAVLAGLGLMRREELLRTAGTARRLTAVRGIAEVIHYARHTPPVLVVLLMMLVIGILAFNFNVLIPVLASRTLSAGPQVFGLLSASFGGGAVCGALLSTRRHRSSWPIQLGAAAALGVGELALAPQKTVVACTVILALTGASYAILAASANITLQLTVPDHMRGRVLSLAAYAFIGTAPVGGLLAGWLSQRAGTELAFFVGGAGASLAAMGGAAWWRVYRIQAR